MENKIYTDQIKAGRRTYFLDIKESIKQTKYLTITESKKKDDGSFERNNILIFEEDIENFVIACTKAAFKIKELKNSN